MSAKSRTFEVYRKCSEPSAGWSTDKRGELTKVCKDARPVVYEYTDRNGKLCNEIMSNVDLYRLQKSFYEKRAATVGMDPWQKGK